MKKVLLKFADSILSKNEMKSLKGGNPYGGGGETCGSCWNSVANQVAACGNPPWSHTVCMCPSGRWNDACG